MTLNVKNEFGDKLILIKVKSDLKVERSLT